MRKLLSYLLTLVAAVLAIPTVLILASWNSLPGDSLYPVKTGLEDVALKILGPTPLVSGISVKFTERRFSEANTLLSRQGETIGFALLIDEAENSKEIIVRKRDEKSAARLVEKIEQYQAAIQKQQETVAQQANIPVPKPLPSPSPVPSPLPRGDTGQEAEEPVVCIQAITPARNPDTGECREFSTPCDVPSGWVKVDSCGPPPVVQRAPQPSLAPVPAQIAQEPQKAEEVAFELEETKKELEKIKEEIKKELPEAAAEKAKEKHKKREQREKEHENEDKED